MSTQTNTPTRADGVARSGHTLLRRILGNSGAPISQASLASIAYTVTDLSTRQRLASGVALTISSVVFDSLQNDALWQAAGGDSAGYNFRATIPAACFTGLGNKVQVDVVFTPVSGELWRDSFIIQLAPTYA